MQGSWPRSHQEPPSSSTTSRSPRRRLRWHQNLGKQPPRCSCLVGMSANVPAQHPAGAACTSGPIRMAVQAAGAGGGRRGVWTAMISSSSCSPDLESNCWQSWTEPEAGAAYALHEAQQRVLSSSQPGQHALLGLLGWLSRLLARGEGGGGFGRQ